MPRGVYKPFTGPDKDLIRREYLRTPTKQIAAQIGCSFGRVMRFLESEGLEIPQSVRDARKNARRFKKGRKSHNKGVPRSEWMSPGSESKCRASQFKKGHIPHNENPEGDGAVVVRKDPQTGRPYKWLRISRGEWTPLHREVWTSHNGEIPEGMIVRFKDGDSLNVEIGNLELISKKENALRNSKHKFPEEIIPTMLLINELEHKLKQIKDG